jgi:hypothetical protein
MQVKIRSRAQGSAVLMVCVIERNLIGDVSCGCPRPHADASPALGIGVTTMSSGKLILLSAVCILVIIVASAGVSIGDDRLVFTDNDLRDYMDRWLRRDGIAGRVISDYFLDYFSLNPGTFLRIMSERPDVFGSWLEELPRLSFVDGSGCVDLECRKAGLIQLVRVVQTDETTELLRLRLLAKLERIEVRNIE